jgi:hypothetical protein
MAEAHLDHPGEVSWFVGHGPAPVIGPCPHVNCRHLGGSNIAWGPDIEHYVLDECSDCLCRAWSPDNPRVETLPDGSLRILGNWLQVDLTREHKTTREERQLQAVR